MITFSNAFRLGCFLAAFTCGNAHAGEWRPLFDGKTLNGWRQLGGDAEYRVEDEQIIGTSVADTPNSFLVTQDNYGDFALEFEFLVDPGLNSGVQFRSLSKPEYKSGRVHGYQYEIDTSSRAWSAGIYDEARRGWLYPVSLNPSASETLRTGEWNQGRIECIGNEIRTYLNGRLVARLVDDETSEGFIALQVHSISDAAQAGSEVRWRNIRVDTDPEPRASGDQQVYIRNTVPNSLSEDQVAQGWTLLFDGAAPRGLIGLGQERFPESGWVVQDEALVITGSALSPLPQGGDIVTERQYGAFEFECEFKLTAKANSGIKYFVDEYSNKKNGGSAIVGLEYQLLDDERHPDANNGRDGNRTCASLYDLIPAADRAHGRSIEADVGVWNHARIVARPDGTVQHWLNGFKALEYQRGSDAYKALVAASKYRDFENFGMAERGRILLQDHTDEVHFRSLRIREFD